TAFETLAQASESDPGWSVHRLALGRSDGQAQIRVSECTDFSSFRRLNAFGEELFPEARVTGSEQVEVRRLDGILAAHAQPRPDACVLLKIDTQGSDLDVLEGATGVLDSVAVIQTEVPLQPIYDGVAGFPEMLEKLNDLGFGLSGVFAVNADEGLRLIE